MSTIFRPFPADSAIPNQSAAWRPAEWSRQPAAILTVPASATTQYAVYAFDAVLRIEHARELRRTEHPIQTSASSPVASITDHAYQLPARVTLEIGMSDAMQSFYPNSWTGAASKSISAYQTLVSLQQARTLVTLTTRLETYLNMLIESIRPTDSVKTLRGLRATVVFGQMFFGGVSSAPGAVTASADDLAGAAPARPQTTASTPMGTVHPAAVPSGITTQNGVTAATTVPGAGKWSGFGGGTSDGHGSSGSW
jgi:hypothetical protein